MLSRVLVDGDTTDADILAGRLADGQAGEKVGCFRVMAVALMAVLFVELREDQKVIPMTRERIERGWEFVLGTLLFREPTLFPNAVWEIDTRHADRRLNVRRGGGSGDRFSGGGR